MHVGMKLYTAIYFSFKMGPFAVPLFSRAIEKFKALNSSFIFDDVNVNWTVLLELLYGSEQTGSLTRLSSPSCGFSL